MRNIRAFREAIRDLVNRYVSIEVFSIWHNRHAYNRRKYVILSTIKNWMPWLFWFFAVYSALGLVRFKRCLVSFDPKHFVRFRLINSFNSCAPN